MKSRQRAVSAKRGRVCFTNRGRVLAKNKRLSKRRATTVREGDAIQHDATRRSRKHTKRVAQESRRWKKERDVNVPWKGKGDKCDGERRRKTTGCKRTIGRKRTRRGGREGRKRDEKVKKRRKRGDGVQRARANAPITNSSEDGH